MKHNTPIKTAPTKDKKQGSQAAEFIQNLQKNWAVLFPNDKATQSKLAARVPS